MLRRECGLIRSDGQSGARGRRICVSPVVVAALLISSSGCATFRASDAPEQADYVLTYLKTGPNSAGQTKEESAKIFGGHMANMQRLAAEGDLVIAGPFGSPRDKSWRGILLLDTGDLDRAKELVATDPGIQAGVFVAEMHPVRGAASLRHVPEYEAAMLAEQAIKKEEAPANIRGYVMVTAEDGASARKALTRAEKATGRTIWSLRILDGDGKGGVFVTDAKDAESVSAALERVEGVGVDGWWSTTSITRLPAEAGEWVGR
jgi:uncharacterized protein YciI